MLGWMLRRGARAFGNKYNYDTCYMEEVIGTSTSAGLRLSAFPLISQYRGPKAGQEVWVGALLGSTLEGDCGPCTQLVIDMALEAGVDQLLLQMCVEGQAQKAGDVGLGFRYAHAAITGGLSADDLRSEIEQKYGPKAVIAAAFATATGRFYPVFKRGLGHGAACSRLSFGDAETILGSAT